MQWLPDYNTVKGRLARLFIYVASPLIAVFWLPAVQSIVPDATPAWKEYYAIPYEGAYDWINSWNLEFYDITSSDVIDIRLDKEALIQTCLLSITIFGAVVGSLFFVMKPKLVNRPPQISSPCDGSCGSGCPSHIRCTNPSCGCSNHEFFKITRAPSLPREKLSDQPPGDQDQ